MKNYTKHITLGIFALAIVASPLASFAKENDNKQGNGKNESRKEIHAPAPIKVNNDKDHQDELNKMRNNTCYRTYGHFFAFGWMKKNNDDRRYLADNCRFPFGINKKFHGQNASTTPDVTAPVITAVKSAAGKVQSDIRWTTNEYADSVVFWGTSSTVDTSDSASNKTSNTHLTKSHQVLLKNLTASTTYYFIVKSKDIAGNVSLSGVNSFTTKVPTIDTQYPVISSVLTVTGTTTINVGWKTSENTTDRVYYSTILPVTINASTTSYVSNASTTKTHAMNITGLNPETTYYLVIESTDMGGNVTTSATFSAKTLAAPMVVVTDTTAPAITNIVLIPGASTSTITWLTDEPATTKLFYSTTTPVDVGSSSTPFAVNNTLVTSHSVQLTGLATSTVYYFKVQSADNANNTQTSGEVRTTTLSM